jgi:transcriptional regulator with XRE-family HTH domain
MLNSKEIGKRIKDAREKADLSLNDVALKLGVNKSTILRYENGEISKERYEHYLSFLKESKELKEKKYG